jgi:hypothetical protein
LAESTKKNHIQRQNPQQNQDQRHEYANGITLWNPGIRKVPKYVRGGEQLTKVPKRNRRALKPSQKCGTAGPIPEGRDGLGEAELDVNL